MKTTLFNTRMCISCRSKENKFSLIKVTRSFNNWNLDLDYSIQGRSIYVHDNIKCINKFLKMQKRFNISDEDFLKISTVLKENVEQRKNN